MALLEVRGLNVSFGGLRALRDVDLDVDAGMVTGLIGPNGAGKTTIFNVVCGLQDPGSGRVTLAGRDITGLATHRRARLGMGRTFQRLELFGSLTARENILTAAEMAAAWIGSDVDPQRAAEAIVERVGLRAVADEPADTLPTGQARLVELGRALAGRPRILLLDEPASGLDDGERATLAALLEDLAGSGVAVVLVEHDVALVMDVCARICVLAAGAVLAVGSPTQIQQNEAVVSAYLGRGADR